MLPLANSEKTPAQLQAEIAAEKGLAGSKPKSKSAHILHLADFVRNAPANLPDVDLMAFRQEWGDCQQHGRYALNALVDHTRPDGRVVQVERWVSDCPHCIAARKLSALTHRLGKSNIPKRFAGADFDNYQVSNDGQAAALAACRAYADNFRAHREQGDCAILYGNPGNGKNHLATAVVKSVLDHGFSGLIITARDYLEEVWGQAFEEKKRRVQGYAGVDLLVIDEVGKSSKGKAAQDEFFSLINARYLEQLPTMVISNLPIRGIEAEIGEMAFDRLRDGDGRVSVPFTWDSWRGQ